MNEKWRLFAVLSMLVMLSAGDVTSATASEVIVISQANCRFLARYRKDGDVDYKPGVDVTGRPVVPAEGPDGAATPHLKLPDVIRIDIRDLLRRRFGLRRSSRLFRTEARIGVVEVRGHDVFFDGQRISAPEQQALAAWCRARKDQPRP